MDKKCKVESTKTLLETPHFDVVVDHCRDFADKERDYYRTDSNSSYVMVVPVKINKASQQISYVMVEQYRHGCGEFCLEFPAGKRDKGESSAAAAARELKEETGYESKHLKFCYTQFLSPVRGPSKQAVFLAVVEGEPEQPQREETEVGSAMKTVELTADELHKKVLNNEITSACSLGALCAVMLSSKQATKYLEMKE